MGKAKESRKDSKKTKSTRVKDLESKGRVKGGSKALTLNHNEILL